MQSHQTYIHTHMYTYINTYIHTYSISANKYTYTHTYIHIVFPQTNEDPLLPRSAICNHIIHTCIHTHIHTYIYTQIQYFRKQMRTPYSLVAQYAITLDVIRTLIEVIKDASEPLVVMEALAALTSIAVCFVYMYVYMHVLA